MWLFLFTSSSGRTRIIVVESRLLNTLSPFCLLEQMILPLSPTNEQVTFYWGTSNDVIRRMAISLFGSFVFYNISPIGCAVASTAFVWLPLCRAAARNNNTRGSLRYAGRVVVVVVVVVVAGFIFFPDVRLPFFFPCYYYCWLSLSRCFFPLSLLRFTRRCGGALCAGFLRTTPGRSGEF